MLKHFNETVYSRDFEMIPHTPVQLKTRILERLYLGAYEFRDLRERLRITVRHRMVLQQTLCRLEQHGWVQRQQDFWCITDAGRRHIEQLAPYHR